MSDLLPITLVVAPSIPMSERFALEAHVKEAIQDPAYTLILNYEAMLFEFVIPENSKVLIIAPGVPVSEIHDLRERFDKARESTDRKDRVLVCNYDVRIDVVDPEETSSYGDVYPTDMDEKFLG